MSKLNVDALLIDLDGVIYVGDQLIEGAKESIEYVKKKGFKTRFLTNTTTRSLEQVFQKLKAFQLPIEKDEIITAPIAANRYLKKQKIEKCYLIMNEKVSEDFGDFMNTDRDPEVIIIGDIGSNWDYSLMNKIFHLVFRGAKLIALHKGRYGRKEKGTYIDIGAFVTGLEYSTGTEAVVIGKPSPSFFSMAIEDLDLPAERIAMIGDDIDLDIEGAKRSNIKSALVKTGKYNPNYYQSRGIKPDLVLDSIADLIKFF